ncbi:MAG TPA: T9SS type A sorting domain-containing protein, partial [Chitinophagales bacterium]|nr:T9SS type A sorting domain-containing protein [Chitinophagales bacterium]
FTFSPSTGIWNSDSSKDIEITNSYYFAPYIDFIKGQMPITMYWDMSLFYSTNLPYPDLTPYPNAVGLVYCNAGEPGYVNCPSAFDDDPLSMVDSINVYYEFPIASPHLFDGSGIPPYDEPEEVLGSFVVAILPFEIYNSILYIDYNPNEVTPNPFTDYISIQGDDYISLINLYNTLGQIIKTIHPINSYSYVLLTEDLQNGIYYLEVEKNKKRNTYIILKQ